MNGRIFVVEDYQGRRVGDIETGWKREVILAGELSRTKGIEINLCDVTPHTLKHTAITWVIQKGASPWDAAGYFSTSLRTIEEVYGHHNPRPPEERRGRAQQERVSKPGPTQLGLWIQSAP